MAELTITLVKGTKAQRSSHSGKLGRESVDGVEGLPAIVPSGKRLGGHVLLERAERVTDR